MKILDVVGKTYNGITILEKLPSGVKPSGQKFSMVLCKWKCGKVFESKLYPITSGKKTHCGCESFISFKGQLGKRYGRIIITGIDLEKSKQKQEAHVTIKCDCGVEKTVSLDTIKRGHVLSCGCYSREVSSLVGKSKRTHGMSKTPEYQTWSRIKGRCYNPNNPDFYLYGARGIIVCNRWKYSFENFLEDMGKRPDGLEIDRIDHRGNYEPSNCRWATEQVQAWNRGRMSTNMSGKDGVTFNKSSNKWEARISKDCNEISLGLYNNLQDAVVAREEAEVKLYGKVKNPFVSIRLQEDMS